MHSHNHVRYNLDTAMNYTCSSQQHYILGEIIIRRVLTMICLLVACYQDDSDQQRRDKRHLYCQQKWEDAREGFFFQKHLFQTKRTC